MYGSSTLVGKTGNILRSCFLTLFSILHSSAAFFLFAILVDKEALFLILNIFLLFTLET